MKQCPACKRDLEDDFQTCPFDGETLSDASDVDRLIDSLLDSKYRIVAKIGQGGMGTVYRAIHVEMENSVAVKVLHPHLSSDRVAVERFRLEARAAAQIHHPNAVAVTDFGVTQDSRVAYLVMEFLEGYDLRDKIKKNGHLNFEDTLNILQQTCAAINAAHDKGIIHRDLKPDNIWLMNPPGQVEHVKVLDFGIAKLKTSDTNTLTQKGTILGTPYYMSPEQCRGEELDARSDIYSLGVIVYEMLTGKVPFDGKTPLAVVLKHNTEPPKSLRSLRPDIPEAIDAVVLRALSKKREDRQDSALEFAYEFREAMRESSLLAPASDRSTAPFDLPSNRTQKHDVDPTDWSQGATVPFKSIQPPTSGPIADETQAIVSPSGGKVAKQTGSAIKIAPDTRFTSSPEQSGSSAPETAIAIQPVKSKVPYYAGAAIVAVIAVIAVVFLVKPGGGGGGDPQPTPTQGGAKVPPGMVLVSAGKFLMGSNENNETDPKIKDFASYAVPGHEVSVNAFYLDRDEVTNEEYKRFIRDSGHQPPENWSNGEYPPGTSKLPVTYVSWDDAVAYAKWANKRLPTEAEWEYAARGSEDRIYPWGNNWSPKFSNSLEDGKGAPVSGGSYPEGRSWCSVNDLAGNVAEWVADDFKLYPGSTAKPQNPGLKVFRGGAFDIKKDLLKTYFRWANYPTKTDVSLGFRCAKDATN